MKKILLTTFGFLAGISLLTSCANSKAASTSSAAAAPAETESQSMPLYTGDELEMKNQIYRGKVTQLSDTQVTLEQLDGYNYGQQEIIFNISDETEIADGMPALAVDAYVEAVYNGILTRSLPAQGNALSLKIISAFSDNIIVNGTIQETSETNDGYTLTVQPLGSESTEFTSMVVLHVSTEGLENITFDELVEGTKISAVTSGIATMSLPPQMPVVVLLPYNADGTVYCY